MARAHRVAGPLRWLGSGLVLACLALPAAAQVLIPVTDLPPVPVEPLPAIVLPAGVAPGTVTGIATGGTVVAGFNGLGQGFRWNRITGAVDTISTADPTRPVVAALVSADGRTVTADVSFGNFTGGAFRWREDAPTLIALGTLPGAASGASVAALSADGAVAVGTADLPAVPVRWTGTDIEAYPAPAGPTGAWPQYSGLALAVSADGSVAVGAVNDAGLPRPVRWTAAGAELLPDPAGFRGWSALAVSAEGSFLAGAGFLAAGATSADRARSFRVGPAGTEVLADLPFGERMAIAADGSRIFSSNASGIVARDGGVGFVTVIPVTRGAFVWTEGRGTEELFAYLAANGVAGLDGWRAGEITAVSADAGWVAGTAFSPAGVAYQFLAPLAPVPLPGGAWLLATAVAGVVLRVRRTHRAA